MAAIHSLTANSDPQLAQMRLPPHSLEAEQAVLGGLLLDNSAWDRIGDVVSESDFYRQDHRQILRAIVRQIAENRPADAVTVSEALQSMGQLENVGGLAYIVALASNTPSAANIRRYAEIVRERSVMRRLAEVATGIADTAYAPAGRSASQLLDEAEAKVFEIAESGSRGQAGFTEIKPLLKEVVERIDELYHRDNDSGVTGVPTGFHDLDQKTSGLQPGDLIIVAGRPSMGKTAFSINIAENVALDTGLPVAVFSMEMGGTQLVMRMIGSVGKLDQHRLRTGKLGEDDWQRLTYALGKLNDAPVFIDETPGLNVLELRARARRLMRQCGKLGPHRDRLHPADVGQQLRREPRHRDFGNLARIEGPGEGTARAGDRAVAAEPQPGTAPQQASGDVRPARIGRHRAGCRRHPLHLPRRGLQPRHAGQGHGRNHHQQAA